jgi:hypothetical protein
MHPQFEIAAELFDLRRPERLQLVQIERRREIGGCLNYDLLFCRKRGVSTLCHRGGG